MTYKQNSDIKNSFPFKAITSKAELLKKIRAFNKLNTVSEKLNFWKKSLNSPYIFFLNTEKFNEYKIFSAFKIIAQEKEWAELNKWIIENYSNKKDDPLSNSLLLDLKSIWKEFKINLKQEIQKRKFIIDEIKKINDSFREIDFIGTYQNLSDRKFSNEFNAFHSSYSDYLTYQETPDYSKFPPDLQILSLENGKILAEYVLLLQNELKKNPAAQIEEENPLTIKQIALILYYTELFENPSSDTSTKAKVLSPLLNFNYKGIYDAIREAPGNGRKNREDIERVIIFLNNMNLKKFTRQAVLDLKKLDRNI